MQSFQSLQINTDGGSRNNPGPAAIGVYASSNSVEVFSLSHYLGIATNNEAEYQAVIYALHHLLVNNIKSSELTFVLDSELILRQITGVYKVKQSHLQNLKSEVLTLIENLRQKELVEKINFVNVLREKNKEADRLVNLALDSTLSK